MNQPDCVRDRDGDVWQLIKGTGRYVHLHAAPDDCEPVTGTLEMIEKYYGPIEVPARWVQLSRAEELS